MHLKRSTNTDFRAVNPATKQTTRIHAEAPSIYKAVSAISRNSATLISRKVRHVCKCLFSCVNQKRSTTLDQQRPLAINTISKCTTTSIKNYKVSAHLANSGEWQQWPLNLSSCGIAKAISNTRPCHGTLDLGFSRGREVSSKVSHAPRNASDTV